MVTLRCIKNPFTMKKITLVLVSLLTLTSLVGKADLGDVIPIEITKETDPQEIPRSSTPEVECFYLVSSSLLEIQFNINAGSIAVAVTDQANTLIGSGTLPATPGSLFVPVGTGTGICSILIETSSGDRYSGRFIQE